MRGSVARRCRGLDPTNPMRALPDWIALPRVRLPVRVVACGLCETAQPTRRERPTLPLPSIQEATRGHRTSADPSVPEVPPDRPCRGGRPERQFGALVPLPALRHPVHGPSAPARSLVLAPLSATVRPGPEVSRDADLPVQRWTDLPVAARPAPAGGHVGRPPATRWTGRDAGAIGTGSSRYRLQLPD